MVAGIILILTGGLGVINVSNGQPHNGEITKAEALQKNPKVLISLHITAGIDTISVDRKAPKIKLSSLINAGCCRRC